jgi:hypothetical protein
MIGPGDSASIASALTTVSGTGACMPSVRMREPVTMIGPSLLGLRRGRAAGVGAWRGVFCARPARPTAPARSRRWPTRCAGARGCGCDP